jgi:hypothetical protein
MAVALKTIDPREHINVLHTQGADPTLLPLSSGEGR